MVPVRALCRSWHTSGSTSSPVGSQQFFSVFVFLGLVTPDLDLVAVTTARTRLVGRTLEARAAALATRGAFSSSTTRATAAMVATTAAVMVEAMVAVPQPMIGGVTECLVRSLVTFSLQQPVRTVSGPFWGVGGRLHWCQFASGSIDIC